MPSTAILSPGRTRISSPGMRLFGSTRSSTPSRQRHRLPRRKRADAVDGGASAQRTALFEEAAEFEEERDQRGGHEVAGRRRREHGDGDQLVGGPARVSRHDARAGPR